MRRIVYAVLLSGMFLMMLSSLVVIPEAPPELPLMPLPESLHAVFRPLVSAILPEAAAVPESRTDARLMVTTLPLLVLCGIPPIFTRDANGRVLMAGRYENSVHQLFRPEIAGG